MEAEVLSWVQQVCGSLIHLMASADAAGSWVPHAFLSWRTTCSVIGDTTSVTQHLSHDMSVHVRQITCAEALTELCMLHQCPA